MDISKIPPQKQRQDSLLDQLADLQMVANRLGMYDAADAIKQWSDIQPTLEYGCYCDLDEGMEPLDDCVINEKGDIVGHCIYAKKGMRKEMCEYWKIK